MDPARTAPAISILEWAGLAIAVLVWVGVAFLLVRRRTATAAPPAWLAGGTITLACLASAAVLGALLTNHKATLVELANQSWFIVPMVVIAIIAFLAKLKFGIAYGALEIIVAILTFWFSIRAHNDSLLVKGLGLSGGVYIFVRGSETIRNNLRRRD